LAVVPLLLRIYFLKREVEMRRKFTALLAVFTQKAHSTDSFRATKGGTGALPLQS